METRIYQHSQYRKRSTGELHVVTEIAECDGGGRIVCYRFAVGHQVSATASYLSVDEFKEQFEGVAK